MSGGSVLLLAIAAVCAGLMGFAIQRGATCMVAAMEQVVEQRRFSRLVALLEAAVVVSGGLALAYALGRLPMPPSALPVTAFTIAGGMLLGLGAVVTRACVFGAIARLGSGEWAYVAVPPGFFLGCLVAGRVTGTMPSAPPVLSPVLAAATFLLLPFGLFALWRLWTVVRAARSGMLARHVWSPHVATSIIGLTFVILLLSVGPWSYTDALAQAARGMSSMTALRLLLFACLLGGALIGGWTAGRLKARAPTAAALLRCLAGGALMGVGSLLIPGSNDGLILIGTPLLQPHAILALSVMAITIAVALTWRRRVMALRPEMA